MRKGIIGIGGAILLIALAAAWYFISPAMALSGLKEAALAGDKAELEERVDFPAVRDSLKSQFKAHMLKEVAKSGEENGFAAFGAMLAMSLADSLVDAAVTPDGIKTMVENGKLANPQTSAAPATVATAKPVDWQIERQGFDRFRAVPKSEDSKGEAALVFKRDGLGWRLIDIDMPDDLGSGGA